MYRLTSLRLGDILSLRWEEIVDFAAGGKCEIRGIKEYDKLPENCKKYVEFIEEQIGYPITMISNGPGRDDIIYRKQAE